ncbi:MAG TPA: hypothetical protein VMU16_03425 [Candidatus Binataceae bacterium]|nr:hypothetical protein [Candidatus Binataceae bacterium]
MRRASTRLRFLSLCAAASITFITSSGFARDPKRLPGAIAFIDTDGNLDYLSAQADEPRCLTCPQSTLRTRVSSSVRPIAAIGGLEAKDLQIHTTYLLPTFSRDGKRLAYASQEVSGSDSTSALWLYDLATRQPIKIFESDTGRIIYIYWLPDERRLSFLVSDPSGLTLMLADAKESSPIRIVTTGLPIFFDWGAAKNRLAIHSTAINSSHTEQVALINLTPTDQKIDRVLERGYSPFRTPSWSPDGKHLAYVGNEHGAIDLLITDSDGQNPRSIAKLPTGETSFIWAPDSRHIAYSTAPNRPEPVYHGIKLAGIDESNIRSLTANDTAAFFFAPDSRHLAYVGVPPNKPYYTWHVVDLGSGADRDLGNFLSTSEESIAYSYFDQLAVSHTIWAPDSSAFVYAGVRLQGAPDRPLATTPPPMVWVVPVDGSAPRAISTGVAAFFSPPAGN